ncbi:MAG TPA: bifunctional helix-turn-helix transcriptional regulator/GNAT family N-acetyltransferase [Acidimicrobiales bacterium]
MTAVATVRSFNRFYTRWVGALAEGLLDSPWSLAEARVLFELAQADATEVVDLRERLGLDAGYLSRILARLEGAGLVERTRSAADARRSVAGLTAAGRAAFRELDARSAEQIGALLDPLDGTDRRRLVGAMATIRSLLGDGERSGGFVLRPLEPGDHGWVVERHGALYAAEHGWDVSFEALVARIVADYLDGRDPARETAWIAEVDGERVGCVFCVRHDDETAQLRLLLVDPRARGAGIGARLVDECLRFARRAGYRRIRLWTNDVLAAARRIYQRAGFELEAEEPHHSYGRDLVGQTWSRAL